MDPNSTLFKQSCSLHPPPPNESHYFWESPNKCLLHIQKLMFQFSSLYSFIQLIHIGPYCMWGESSRIVQASLSWCSWGIRSVVHGLPSSLSTIIAGKQLEESLSLRPLRKFTLQHLAKNVPRMLSPTISNASNLMRPEWCWIPWGGGQNGPFLKFGATLEHLGPKAGCFFMKKTVCSSRGSKPVQGTHCYSFIYIILSSSFLPQPQSPN